jgi:hypothetical protein
MVLPSLRLVVFLKVSRRGDVTTSEQRSEPAKWVRKPSDRPAPCFANRRIVNTAAIDDLSSIDCVGQKGHVSGVGQSFHLFIGAMSVANALGRLDVWKGPKHSIEKGNFAGASRCEGRGVRREGRRLILGEGWLRTQRVRVGRI